MASRGRPRKAAQPIAFGSRAPLLGELPGFVRSLPRIAAGRWPAFPVKCEAQCASVERLENFLLKRRSLDPGYLRTSNFCTSGRKALPKFGDPWFWAYLGGPIVIPSLLTENAPGLLAGSPPILVSIRKPPGGQPEVASEETTSLERHTVVRFFK